MMNDKNNEQEVRVQELTDEEMEEVFGGRSAGMRTLMKDKAFADNSGIGGARTGSVAPKSNGDSWLSWARRKNP